MSTDFWHGLVSKLQRIEEDWKPRHPHPNVATASYGSFMGSGVLSTENSWHMPPGVVTSLPGYQSLHRVSNVNKYPPAKPGVL